MGNIVTVDFQGGQVFGFEGADGVYLAIKPITEAMGLEWSPQLKRIRLDPILSDGMAIMTPPSGRDGMPDTSCLRLELVNGWLLGVNASEIRNKAVRARILQYQRACYGALAEHFPRKNRIEIVDAVKCEGNDASIMSRSRRTLDVKAAWEIWAKLGLPLVPAVHQ